jgi:hypothetical protein
MGYFASSRRKRHKAGNQACAPQKFTGFPGYFLCDFGLQSLHGWRWQLSF